MKPVLLSMQAFGPFAGTEEIRFADLGNSPLFLINGPTGSGKTTILDAICYALYGTTTGDERLGAEMRCQQSEASLLTTVAFEFELGGNTYRIERSPDQERPKLKGEGTTSQKTRATLFKLGDDGTTDSGELLVEQKVQDATRYIRDITGLNADQFRQVMVLPQGQFRKLLVADSREKQKIFESLFQTSVYKAIEEKLKAASADIRREVEHGKSMVHGILESGDVRDEASLHEEITDLKQQLVDLSDKKQATQQAWEKAEKAVTEALNLKQAFDGLARAMDRESELQQQDAAIKRLEEQARLARAAAGLAPLYRRLAEIERELVSANKEAGSAEDDQNRAVALYEVALQAHRAQVEKSGEREQLQNSLHKLNAFNGKAQLLTEARTTLQSASTALSQAQTAQDNGKRDKLAHEARQLEMAADIEKTQAGIDAAGGLDVKLIELQQAQQYRDDLIDVEQEESAGIESLAGAKVKSHAAIEQRDLSEKRLKRVRQLWHQGQAASLAAELEDGVPCAVCGSREHPAKAKAANETASEQDIEVAQAHYEDSARRARDAEGQVQALSGRLDSLLIEKNKLLSKLGEYSGFGKTKIAAALEHYQALAAKRRADFEKVTAGRARLKTLVTVAAELDKDISLATSAAQRAQLALTQAGTRVELAEQALPERYRDVGQLEADIAGAALDLDVLIQSLKSATDAFQAAGTAQGIAESSLKNAKQRQAVLKQRQRDASEECSQALQSSPFHTDAERLRATTTETAIAALEGKVKAHETELLTTRATRETLQAQLKDKKLIDIVALQTAEEDSRSERDAALGAWRVRDQRMNSLANTASKLAKQRQKMAALDAKYSVVGTLADVACGQTGAKISLQRYILGVLLDDVLVQASQRLMKMSDGRYELIRKRDANKGKTASGLDLEVYDDYSGDSRSVATLSGGESFMAALSLALGLSDVVQAQTGGIQLDTLFVDEGFGTLDSEALELAVSTLMDLQKAGRMVGIISHVSELKEQMDVRIDLTSNKQGSSITVVSPMAAG